MAGMIQFKTVETPEDDQAHDTLSCPEGETTVTRFGNAGQDRVEARRMLAMLHESKFGCGHGPAWLESMGEPRVPHG